MEKEMFISLLTAGLERFGMKVTKSTFRKLGDSYTGLSLPGSASAVFNAVEPPPLTQGVEVGDSCELGILVYQP